MIQRFFADVLHYAQMVVQPKFFPAKFANVAWEEFVIGIGHSTEKHRNHLCGVHCIVVDYVIKPVINRAHIRFVHHPLLRHEIA